MGLIEWYIKIIMGKDPDRVPAFWSMGRKQFKSLSPGERERLVLKWRDFNSGKKLEESEKKEERAPVERETSTLTFKGEKIPGNIRSMSELEMFLELPKKERDRLLSLWEKEKSPSLPITSIEQPESAISGVQLPLFRSSKLKTLFKALRKYSDVR
jgi:hypothetical protein